MHHLLPGMIQLEVISFIVLGVSLLSNTQENGKTKKTRRLLNKSGSRITHRVLTLHLLSYPPLQRKPQDVHQPRLVVRAEGPALGEAAAAALAAAPRGTDAGAALVAPGGVGAAWTPRLVVLDAPEVHEFVDGTGEGPLGVVAEGGEGAGGGGVPEGWGWDGGGLADGEDRGCCSCHVVLTWRSTGGLL
jgi:hypothetical protein